MTWRIPARLGHVTLPPSDRRPLTVYLMPLPDGDPVGLHGTAALIWTLAAEGETSVAECLADLLDVNVGDVRTDVDAYLATLSDQGLLEREP